MVAIIVALLVGSGAGYIYNQSMTMDISFYEEKILKLETELTELQVLSANLYDLYISDTSELENEIIQLQSALENATKAIEYQEEPEPAWASADLTWQTYGIYSINEEVFTSGDFSMPESVEKIRLTFTVTYTYPTPQYVLNVNILQDGVNLWKREGTYGIQTKIWEIEGISGDFTINVLIVLGRAQLKVEWCS